MRRGLFGVVKQIIQGAPGTNGVNGTAGASAYDIAVQQGYVGTAAQWAASMQSAGSMTLATGTTKTTVVLLGANADLPAITLSRPMPNANYKVDILPAAGLLGAAIITVKSKTATTVTLNVSAGLAIAAGLSISVIATT
jgi:hypothetical protein